MPVGWHRGHLEGGGGNRTVVLVTVEDAGDELGKVFKLGGRAGVPITLI